MELGVELRSTTGISISTCFLCTPMTVLLNKVQSQQNRAITMLYNKHYHTPTIPLHKHLSMLIVKDIFKQHILKFVYKYQHSLLPPIFPNCYTWNLEIYSYNTRQNNKLYHHQISNNYGMIKIKYHGKIEYNILPKTIIQSDTIKSFTIKQSTTYDTKTLVLTKSAMTISTTIQINTRALSIF